MKILMATHYYYPYRSGLSEYVRLLAEGLVRRGHEVRVLVARHRSDLPTLQCLEGVSVERLPVAINIHRAAVMPGYIPRFLARAQDADVVNIHLPLPECLPLFLLLRNRATAATFHCTIDLGQSPVWRTLERIYNVALKESLRHADRIVVNSIEYFESLNIPGTGGRVVEIHPPVKDLPFRSREVEKRRFGVEGRPTVGFLGRPVAEKGITDLVRACRILSGRFPDLSLLIAGNTEAVGPLTTGDLEREIRRTPDVRFHFLGQLEEEELGTFYAACDVLVLPSINAMESFGMVQVEAMLCGTPVVASNLPGVRVPVTRTGMGVLSEPRNPASIADGISAVLKKRSGFLRPRDVILDAFGRSQSILRYEELFREVMESRKRKTPGT